VHPGRGERSTDPRHKRPDLDSAFATAASVGGEALTDIASPLFLADRARFEQLALDYRLPSIGSLPQYAEAGLLMSNAAGTATLLRHGAALGAVRGTTDRLRPVAKTRTLPKRSA
jgi:hypothetical protein